MTAALSVTMTSAPRVNLALQQNGVPLLRDLVVSNTGPEDEHLVRVTVTAEPPLFVTRSELSSELPTIRWPKSRLSGSIAIVTPSPVRVSVAPPERTLPG